jgi:hypothetical protein
MDVPSIENPFAVMTAIVAPAVLTNACTVLALGTSNRIARVVDRTRVITTELGQLDASTRDYRIRVDMLARQRERGTLLMRALRILYGALGGFAASALISVVGSGLAFYGQRMLFRASAILALTVGALAVGGLVFGCALLVQETRIALVGIQEEADFMLQRDSAPL